MLAFLKANYLTILIILVLVAIVVGIICSIVKDKKAARNTCGANCAHKKIQAEIISAEPLDEAALRKAIGDTGYTVTDVHTEPYKKKGLFGH